MNIDDHKKSKTRHTGKDVRISYDLKRERDRAAVESAGMRARLRSSAPSTASAPARARPATKRPRRMAAE